jgi:CHAD domain-containing protein
MYRRVRKEGRAITSQSPASDLHELRKSCKKLRYLIEFFVSIYPEEAVKPLVKALKRLLDNLGEFQDLEVHADHLREFTGQMQAEGEVPLSTLLSMGGLVAGLLQRQVAAREVFDKRFKRFDVPEHRAAYRSLFRAQTEALESR